MSLTGALIKAAAGAAGTLFVDDVFSITTYTGTGAAQDITNGVDLAGEGGLVWLKNRLVTNNNAIFDTNRGQGKIIYSNSTSSEATNGISTRLTSFNSDGFSLGTDPASMANAAGNDYVSFTFRKASKFFDVVTYTGNGANRTLPHNLGSVPGMILVKSLSNTSSWVVYHQGSSVNPETEYLVLNSTGVPTTAANAWNNTQPTSTEFSLGTGGGVNANGVTYVAYLFAHDISNDGIIQCGTFTTAAGVATVSLGWEPQFVLTKAISVADNWCIGDTVRGLSHTHLARLIPNLNNIEDDITSYVTTPTVDGFDAKGFSSEETYIYVAIRRPMKPPMVGTDVYKAVTRTGTGAVESVTGLGFSPDLIACRYRSVGADVRWVDKLRGSKRSLNTTSVNADDVYTDYFFFSSDGYIASNTNTFSGGVSYLEHLFKRAPTFFDIVCYKGTGSATTIPHGLGAVPELMLLKRRSTTGNWRVYHKDMTSPAYSFALQTGNAESSTPAIFNSTTPTASVFSIGNDSDVNFSGSDYIAYLFTTLTGISKVGTYTGNGTSQTISCDFSTGARFVMIKRKDNTGEWYVWDNTRGIVLGNDPRVSLDRTDAEVTTDDSIDPDNSGFTVNQLVATNINVNAATYIYLAIS